MAETPTTDQLIEDFSFLESWEDRYGYLLEMGRDLAPLTEEEKTTQTHVKGCVSQVWLVCEEGPSRTLTFRGDSDSLIVQGLIAVLLVLFSGQDCKTILETDPAPVLDKLGLIQHLTPQRANGFAAMIQRIKAEAAAICAKD